MTRAGALFLALAPLLPGCLSAELVHWAGVRLTPGSPVGVVRSPNAPDAVVYGFEATSSAERSHVALRVPRDWRELPRRSRPAPDGGSLVGIEPPIEWESLRAPPSELEPIGFLDHRLTLARAVPERDDPGSRPVAVDEELTLYGIVRYLTHDSDGRTRELHEVFAYDPLDYRWVSLGSLDVGPQRRNRTALAGATVLFLPALVVDIVGNVALFLVQFGLASGGGGGDPYLFIADPDEWEPAPVSCDAPGEPR